MDMKRINDLVEQAIANEKGLDGILEKTDGLSLKELLEITNLYYKLINRSKPHHEKKFLEYQGTEMEKNVPMIIKPLTDMIREFNSENTEQKLSYMINLLVNITGNVINNICKDPAVATQVAQDVNHYLNRWVVQNIIPKEFNDLH